jgi:hypothetical protein
MFFMAQALRRVRGHAIGLGIDRAITDVIL